MEKLLDRVCKLLTRVFADTSINYIMCGMALGALFGWITVRVVLMMGNPPQGSEAFLPYVTGFAAMVAAMLVAVMLGLYKRPFSFKATKEGVEGSFDKPADEAAEP